MQTNPAVEQNKSLRDSTTSEFDHKFTKMHIFEHSV